MWPLGHLLVRLSLMQEVYQKQLKLDKKADFYADNKTISYQSIPVVDRDSAIKLGDRKMGSEWLIMYPNLRLMSQ